MKEGRLAEPRQTARQRNVQQTAHDLPRDFAGRMVHVHDRRESRQTQHLRFSGAAITSNYLPFLSSAEIKGPKRHIKIGKYSIPFGKTEIKAMRKGTPFWHWLGKAGIFSSVIRVPVTFPPEKFQGVLLSGMCVPDLKGSQGTFCLCTTRCARRQVSRRRSACSHRAQERRFPFLRSGARQSAREKRDTNCASITRLGRTSPRSRRANRRLREIHNESRRIFRLDSHRVQSWPRLQRTRHLPFLSQRGLARS